MKWSACFAIIIILVAPMAQARAYRGNGYSISEPENWVKIPSQVVEQGEELLARRFPNAKRQHFDSAFQDGNGQHWFAYPYATVQIMKSGRLTLQEIQESVHKSDTGKSGGSAGTVLGGFFSHFKATGVHYDRHLNIIFGGMQTDVAGVGSVVGFLGAMPTRQGYIQVICYALESDLARSGPACTSLIKSITGDISTSYRPS